MSATTELELKNALMQVPGATDSVSNRIVAAILSNAGSSGSGGGGGSGSGLDSTTYTAAQLSAWVSSGTTPTPAPTGLPKQYAASDDLSRTFYGYTSTLARETTANGVSAVTFVSSALSASAVVKGVAGDPGTFLGLLCVSVAGGKVTVHNAGTATNAITGLGAPGGASGLTMTAGSFISLGSAVDCPNGIYLEINGTGSYVVVYQ